MKNKLKTHLRKLLLQVASEADASFSEDMSFSSDTQLASVRRHLASGQWQFIALSFSTLADRFYVEVAYSALSSYPVDKVPLGPDSLPADGVLRFRASELWAKPNRSGGWLIKADTAEEANDTILKPEGVFDSPEAAMMDVKARIVKWILPYLDAVENPQQTP